MKKTYVEVACTLYKTILVEVEHNDDTPIETVIEIAYEATGDDDCYDEMKVVGTLNKKPESVRARYDDYLEIEE